MSVFRRGLVPAIFVLFLCSLPNSIGIEVLKSTKANRHHVESLLLSAVKTGTNKEVQSNTTPSLEMPWKKVEALLEKWDHMTPQERIHCRGKVLKPTAAHEQRLLYIMEHWPVAKRDHYFAKMEKRARKKAFLYQLAELSPEERKQVIKKHRKAMKQRRRDIRLSPLFDEMKSMTPEQRLEEFKKMDRALQNRKIAKLNRRAAKKGWPQVKLDRMIAKLERKFARREEEYIKDEAWFKHKLELSENKKRNKEPTSDVFA